MLNPVNITPPRVEFLDPRTGRISREWYMFFLSLFNLTGSGTTVDGILELKDQQVEWQFLLMGA